MSDSLQLRDRVRWWSPYLGKYVEGTVKQIDHDGFHIQWDPGSGPICSPCRESRYVDGVGTDEWRRQKRRDYLNEYRRKKRAALREAVQ